MENPKKLVTEKEMIGKICNLLSTSNFTLHDLEIIKTVLDYEVACEKQRQILSLQTFEIKWMEYFNTANFLILEKQKIN